MGTPVEPEPVQGDIPDQNEAPGPNPAWNDVLSILPEQFHSVVTPKFQEWDNAAQSRIETLNSSLKEFESYKPFVEHGITPDELEQGVRLMYEIQNNPQGVYEALANAYNFNQQAMANTPVANANDNTDDDDDDPPIPMDDPRYAQINQQLELVSKIVLNDAQAKQAAAADAALEKELEQLRKDHGDFDEDYVLTKALNGASLTDAISAYQSLVQRLTPQPFAPNVLGNSGGGTGLPSNAIDPTKLSGKETRNLVAEMLAAEFGKK